MIDLKTYNKEFFDFLGCCPTAFHTTQLLKERFQDAGFTHLQEHDSWNLESGRGYFCIRDDGTLIGIKLAAVSHRDKPWRMTASHSDSPALQVKPNPTRKIQATEQLCVEVYGGPLLATWFDRDLGIAGRVIGLNEKGSLITCLIDFKRPIAIIPSLAIHLDRTANKDHTIEKQKHLYPLLHHNTRDEFSFEDILLQQVRIENPNLKLSKIQGFDLFCYDCAQPAFIGIENDFIASGRLDNLVSCFAGAKALLDSYSSDNLLFLCSNHEEIGSSTVAGAQGNFLASVLNRLMPSDELRSRILSRSFLLSMDNAHAAHPNFTEKHDPQHLPLLNHGPVIKYNANQRYATTGKSAAMYKTICDEIEVPLQEFVMNNDLACGSTIGPIAATKLGIQTVDIGVPSLAMHSIRETTGAKDPYLLHQTAAHFYSRGSLPHTG